MSHLASADDALPRLELEDLVDEQEGWAVGDQFLDHVPPEGGRECHAVRFRCSRSR